MRLHDRQWGTGDRVALLLHGMMGSSESWWRVAPALEQRGYRVIALDLPGHGLSPRTTDLDMSGTVNAIVSTLDELDASAPAIAMGHSYGGAVLAAGIGRIAPARAIYVDAPFISRGGWDYDETLAEYAESKAARTFERLRDRRPYYSERDCEVEARAAEQFDPSTAASQAAGDGEDWTPSPQLTSLVVRALPSDYVSEDVVKRLRANGIGVRDIPGAAHSVWYSHYDEFLAAIDDQL